MGRRERYVVERQLGLVGRHAVADGRVLGRRHLARRERLPGTRRPSIRGRWPPRATRRGPGPALRPGRDRRGRVPPSSGHAQQHQTSRRPTMSETTESTPAPAEATRQRPERRWMLIAGLAAGVAVLVVGIAAFAVTRNDNDRQPTATQQIAAARQGCQQGLNSDTTRTGPGPG